MVTYEGFRSRVQRMLQDTAGRQYSQDVVYDGFIAAQSEIMPWVPRFATVTLTSGSDGGLFLLPEDLYQVDALQDLRTFQFLPKATLTPKLVRSNQMPNVDWIDYPSGYLSVNEDLAEGVQFKLLYRAYWPKPSSDSDTEFVITVPEVALVGLIYYTCAYVITPRGVTAAGIRQFNTKVDSGNPEDNPLFEVSDYFRKLFYAEMKMMPPFAKAVQT